MGLEVGTVRLEEYSPKWAELFEDEKDELKGLIGDHAKTIEHVGSTSVPGLKAKPIIDIAVGVDKLNEFSPEVFAGLDNYSIKQEPTPGEILIRKGIEGRYTEFLIHIMEIDDARYKEALRFRDLLRNSPELRNQYQALKEELAGKFANNRKLYTKSKDAFIKSVLKSS